jgi:hypothetical protein
VENLFTPDQRFPAALPNAPDNISGFDVRADFTESRAAQWPAPHHDTRI